MKAVLCAASVLAGVLGTATGATAQTAAETLPSGGRTIAGPGFAQGGAARTVLTSANGLSVCVTVAVTTATTSSSPITIKLNPSGLTTTFPAGQQTGTLCGTAVTSVVVSSFSGINEFWRIDRTN